MSQSLTNRAKRRFEIAANLMKLPPNVDVLAEIRKLPKDRQTRLKELVNWVEDYENFENAHCEQTRS